MLPINRNPSMFFHANCNGAFVIPFTEAVEGGVERKSSLKSDLGLTDSQSLVLLSP